jgi:hypothetical protein
VVVTDTVPLSPHKRIPQIQTLSVAPLIGEAIRRIHLGESVGALFSSELNLVEEMLLWDDAAAQSLSESEAPAAQVGARRGERCP